MRSLLLLALAITTAISAAPTPAKTDWFDSARFGLFIHWGVYSVHANQWQGQLRDDLGKNAEWLMQRVPIDVASYKKFGDQFTAANYDPAFIAKLASDAGMKYVVLTSKHHDGFALWPTKTPCWNVMDTPAHRDLIAPLEKAARDQKLHFGLYYSQSQDWTSPGGAKRNPKRDTPGAKRDLDDGDGWDEAHKGDYDLYLKTVALPQVDELLTNYSPEILWFDTPIRMTPERTQPFLDLLKQHPNILYNNRLSEVKSPAYQPDFETPEQYVPPTGLPGKRFEVCMTMDDSWGFTAGNKNWKSVTQILQILSDTVSKGGNLLLNIGPKPDGSIPEQSITRLQEVGAWMRTNAEAIYGTSSSPFPRQLPWGRATQKQNSDGTSTLYLHIWHWPANNTLNIPSLGQSPLSAKLLLSPSTKITATSDNKFLTLQLPANFTHDPHITILALTFKTKPVVDLPTHIPPAADGTFTLRPDDADLYGSTAGVMRLAGKSPDSFITDWFESRWQIRYRINSPSIQSCTATIEVRSKADSSLRIMVDGKTRTKIAIPSTNNEWQTLTFRLPITLPDGDSTLTLRADTTWSPLDIRTLTLTPTK